MVDLGKISGLPLTLSEEGFLKAEKEGIYLANPALRKFEDLLPVLLESNNLEHSKIAYYMYRNIHLSNDCQIFKDNGLRYDITVIFPGLLGKEFTKTLGHYHSRAEFSPYTFPEIYEVLLGEAVFLLQKRNGTTITEVVFMRAKPGDKLLVPPDYGHVTINTGNTILVTSNLMATSATSDHREYIEKRGAIYHLVSKERELVFQPNSRYGTVSPIRELKPGTSRDLCISSELPLYTSFIKNPTKFRYLVNPQECGDLLGRYLTQGENK